MLPIPRPLLERLITRSERVTKARHKTILELRDRLGKRAPLRGRKPKEVTAEEYGRSMAEVYDREGEVREVLFLDAAWHFKTEDPWFRDRAALEDLEAALAESNHPDHALGLAWTALGRIEGEDPQSATFIEACLAREESLDTELSDEGKEAEASQKLLDELAAAGSWDRLLEEAIPRAKKFPANPLFRRHEALAQAGLGRVREALDALWPDLEAEHIDGGAAGARTIAAGILLAGLAAAEGAEAFTKDQTDLRAEAQASLLAGLRRDPRLAALHGVHEVEAAPPPPPPPPPILLDELDEALRDDANPVEWVRAIAREISAPVALRWDDADHGDPSARALLSAARESRGPEGAVRRIGEDAWIAAAGLLDDRAWDGFQRAAARLSHLRTGGAVARAREASFAATRARILASAEDSPERILSAAAVASVELPSAIPARGREIEALRDTLVKLSRRLHARPDPRRRRRAAIALAEPIRARRRAFALARSLAPSEGNSILHGLSTGSDEAAWRAHDLLLARSASSAERARRLAAIAHATPSPFVTRRQANRALHLLTAAHEIAPEEILTESAKETRRIASRLLRDLGRSASEGLVALEEDPLRDAVEALAQGEEWETLRRLVERVHRGRIPEDPTLSVSYAAALARLGATGEAEVFLARVLEASDRAEWRTILGLLETSAVPADAAGRLARRFTLPAPPATKPLAGKKIGFLSNFDNWKPYVDRIVHEMGGEVVWLGGVRNHWKDYVPPLRSCDAVIRFIRTMYHHDPGFDKAVDAAGAKSKTWTHTRGVSALRGFLADRAKSAGW